MTGMERFLTFEYLNSKDNNFEQKAIICESNSYSYNQKVTVFLSHRHNEPIDLIKKVKGFFASQGVNLYIDWLDKDMPKVTNSETAEKLKNKIKTSDKFIVLATPQSIESIWIPWEIGLADQIKGLKNIAVLPLVSKGSNWEKREYYQLYSRIEYYNGKWLVLNPDYNFIGDELSKWLFR